MNGVTKNSAPVRVSVIITSYNASREVLHRAIDSVLKQSFSQIELIVVDDASELPFAGLSTSLKSGISWVKSTVNVGAGAARNLGLAQARGHYVAFLDHDDWWCPKKVETQVDTLESSGLKWCYCAAERYSENGKSYPIPAHHRGNIFNALLRQQCIPGSVSSVMMRRDLLESMGGFSTALNLVEDWDLWLGLSREHDIAMVDKCLVYLSSSPKSRSQNIEARLKRIRGIIEKYEVDLYENDLYDYANSRYFRVRARLYQRAGRFPQAVQAWMKLLKHSPGLLALRGIFSTLLFTLPRWLFRTRPGLGLH